MFAKHSYQIWRSLNYMILKICQTPWSSCLGSQEKIILHLDHTIIPQLYKHEY